MLQELYYPILRIWGLYISMQDSSKQTTQGSIPSLIPVTISSRLHHQHPAKFNIRSNLKQPRMFRDNALQQPLPASHWLATKGNAECSRTGISLTERLTVVKIGGTVEMEEVCLRELRLDWEILGPGGAMQSRTGRSTGVQRCQCSAKTDIV